MLSMESLIVLIALSVLCLGFAYFVWRDGANFRYRSDAREAAKAGDTQADPFILDKGQQPAELQVGPHEEAQRPNRFVPDQLPR